MTKNNETVLITGIAQGIGRGLAIAYAEKGYRVIGCDVNEEKGRMTMKEVDGTFLRCDVSDPKEVDTLFQKIKEPFSILINNAGVSEFKSMFELDVDEWDDVLNTNLRSCFLFSKYAAERWKQAEIPGRIVNMASTRAFMSEPDSEAYAASKGGIFALTHALAASLSPYNIRVNSISPGWIHTGSPDELRDKDHDQHLSNRVGTVEDIAKACFYLTDHENTFVNGENVTIDGGMTRKMIYEH
ncbi:SDR family oxidoreductase [Halobacillus sp. GSS1]|uniref:SDR family NAD(P)-dependent oxidoreductase n=1 Tax=Halobacillus sp. GSS1 TaxID=2815919 RepID=UPI001A8E430C|nr:SDR family oxidoreductase [Halobacillus sp. GSS1]MBN9656484.1 SDR family oxidoreductase [Halobacillus sp. GSS1]